MKGVFTAVCILVIINSGCLTSKPAGNPELPSISYQDQYVIPSGLQFNGTTVGGLSSIDYDAVNNLYYLISDDRSVINPARFYKAMVDVDGGKINSMRFVGVDSFRKPDGAIFTASEKHKQLAPDPEALRFHPGKNRLIWSNEGERLVQDNLFMDPSIYISDDKGKILDSLQLPTGFNMQAASYGPRRNGTFEGLALSPQHSTLYAAMEEPLYQDGDRAGLHDSTAWIRIIQFNLITKQAVAQFGYKIDPVVKEPVPVSAYKVNGVSEILDIGDDRLLVVERSWSTGMKPSNVRIYVAFLSEAEDVSRIASLPNGNVKAVEKKLLFDLDSLPIHIGNIEGITLGPVLPNGNRALLLVSDDNFISDQVSQVLLFEFRDKKKSGK